MGQSTFDSYQQAQLPTHPCLWSGCQERFTSRAHLVDHVNLFHLQLPSEAPAAPPLNELGALPCQWGDCCVKPATDGSSDFMGGQFDLFGFAAHLMHDHLGLTPGTESVGLPKTLSVPGPSSATTSTSPRRCSPPPRRSSKSPSACEVSSENHACRWKDCGFVFANAGELTDHIRDDHLGAGKALYHCYWVDCDRNGEKCLSSKQKALRHIQVGSLLRQSLTGPNK